jgi:hypothetical protein
MRRFASGSIIGSAKGRRRAGASNCLRSHVPYGFSRTRFPMKRCAAALNRHRFHKAWFFAATQDILARD